MQCLLTDLREYWSVDQEKVEKLVPVDCNLVLNKVIETLKMSISKDGDTVSYEDLPTVFADEYPVNLLFQNLITNALKYRRQEADPHVRISAQRTDDVWTFTVADHGIGIQPEQLESIFAPFKRLHGAEYPGTGLGLAMCRKVVERYHGRIWAESRPGKGMKPSEIVLIEDNEADVDLLKLALKASGICYSLTRFERGMEAVQLYCGADQSVVQPDLVLLDLNTPAPSKPGVAKRKKAS
jgi:signal transduction histidine kinase